MICLKDSIKVTFSTALSNANGRTQIRMFKRQKWFMESSVLVLIQGECKGWMTLRGLSKATVARIWQSYFQDDISPITVESKKNRKKQTQKKYKKTKMQAPKRVKSARKNGRGEQHRKVQFCIRSKTRHPCACGIELHQINPVTPTLHHSSLDCFGERVFTYLC